MCVRVSVCQCVCARARITRVGPGGFKRVELPDDALFAWRNFIKQTRGERGRAKRATKLVTRTLLSPPRYKDARIVEHKPGRSRPAIKTRQQRPVKAEETRPSNNAREEIKILHVGERLFFTCSSEVKF